MSNYFQKVPDFDYISRLPDAKISEYIRVKNLFRRGKLRDDIFKNLSFFEKYKVYGDERPDNVAYNYYGSSQYDWLVLLSNNILNVQTEWPMSQESYDTYLIEKYGSYESLGEVHHYETTEVKNANNIVILPAGKIVDETFTIPNPNDALGTLNPVVAVSNYEYEEKIENDKRNIFLLKPAYLNIAVDDLNDILPYQEGSTQYVSRTLAKGENIRIYT